MVTCSMFVFIYLRRRVQQASELMLHYGCISWNVPGQHGHPKIHGLLEKRRLNSKKDKSYSLLLFLLSTLKIVQLGSSALWCLISLTELTIIIR